MDITFLLVCRRVLVRLLTGSGKFGRVVLTRTLVKCLERGKWNTPLLPTFHGLDEHTAAGFLDWSSFSGAFMLVRIFEQIGRGEQGAALGAWHSSSFPSHTAGAISVGVGGPPFGRKIGVLTFSKSKFLEYFENHRFSKF